MVAVLKGRPVDTTMGFTPTGGFMMGTRSGDLDPGLMVYLINQKGYDGRRLERLVNHESGLLGVSAVSSDVKTLLEKRAAEPNAALALEMFCYQMRKQIGALAAVLGGLDLGRRLLSAYSSSLPEPLVTQKVFKPSPTSKVTSHSNRPSWCSFYGLLSSTMLSTLLLM